MKILLTGPAGCGKTYRVLNEFESSLRESGHPLARDYFLILPSSEHTERMITLLFQRGISGFFHHRMTTLSGLLSGVFGAGDRRVASSVTRSLWVARLLESSGSPYFEAVKNQPGFTRLFAGFLSELKEALISPEDFRRHMNRLKQLEPELSYKYEALAWFYEAYEAGFKERGLMDRQDELAMYRLKKETPSRPRFKKVWLDGFFDFSNLQIEYLRELTELSESVVITLTEDAGEHRRELFDPIRKTEEMLQELGFETERMPAKNYRTASGGLTFLERKLFAGETLKKSAAVKTPKPGGDIRIFEAVGIQGEIEMIAREILSLYREGNYRFSDFVILLRNIGGYESVIRSVLGKFKIPVEVHERKRLELSALAESLTNLLKIFRRGWQRDDLINFLKSSYVGRVGGEEKDYEAISRLEHGAWREGVLEGRAAWLNPWGVTDPNRVFWESLNEDKDKILKPLADLEDQFKQAGSFYELKRIFMRVISRDFGILKIKRQVDETVKLEAAQWRRVEALFEEMRTQFRVMNLEKVGFDAFADHLIRLMELDLYSLHDRNQNQVQVYDISLARQKEYRVVFVAGMLEKQFPVEVKEDPVLSDWERTLLNAGARFKLRENLSRQNLERYLFYLASTRAREKIIFTVPRLNLEGKEALPSFYLDEVEGLFTEPVRKIRQDLSHPYPRLEDAVNRYELENAVMGELWHMEEKQKPLEPVLLYLFNHLLEEKQTADYFRKAFGQIRAELKDPLIRKQDYFHALMTSPTRLEEYGKCPYRYFSSKVLQLQDPSEEVTFQIQGRILHKVLEDFFSLRKDKKTEVNTPEKIRAFVLRRLDELLEEMPLKSEKKYVRELDKSSMRETLLRYVELELERLEKSFFVPAYFELTFGDKEGAEYPFWVLRDGKREIAIRGQIDRVDTDQSHTYGLVIDYKRSKGFSKSDMEFGTSLQLPIYLAVMEHFLKLKPAGAQLYSFKKFKASGFYHQDHLTEAGVTEIPKRSTRWGEREFREKMARSFEFIKLYSRNMERLEIPVRPRDCMDQCPYAALCRIEKWRIPEILEKIQKEDEAYFSSLKKTP